MGRLVVTAEIYARAEALLPGSAERLIVGGETTAQFLPGSDRFRLCERTAAGERVLLVDPDAGACEEGDADERPPLGAEWSVSPDGRWAVRAAEGNLFLLDRDSGEERRLTEDGAPAFGYGSRLDWLAAQRQLRGVPCNPLVAWSPDSRRLVVERLDQSAVGEMHLLQLVEDEPRPRLVSYRAVLPGEEEIAWAHLYVVEVASGDVVEVDAAPAPVTSIAPMLFKRTRFSPDGERVEAVIQSRDQRDMRLLSIDPTTGAARTVAEQRQETGLDPALLMLEEAPPARVLADGRAILLSERDGWGHLWLVEDGERWRQLTRGEWVVRELLHVDEGSGELLFTASGREPEGAILDRRLYRVALAGGEPELLTPEPLDHAVTVSPSGRWLVDCQSSPQTPPVTVLRDGADGAIVRELACAEIGKLEAAGWRAPERFTVLSADGETELHGLLYFPPGFEEGGSWPLLDVVYPGPQVGIVPRRFGIHGELLDSFAALGIVVMALDARGTPLRSKAFHDASYGVLESTAALADHAAAVAQLAQRFPGIDVGRVGMTGNSGGGYMTVRALIEQPETFKVGIAGVGNHDNLRYHAGWGERYIGLLEQDPEGWRRQSNVALAAHLRGHLMLSLSEQDTNVFPVCTRALIAALIAADVDHDVVVLPNGDHFTFDSPYYVRRCWDYLVRHLIGAEPPAYAISQESLGSAEPLP